MTENFGVITFATTGRAIQGEAAFDTAGLHKKMIPTPREISLSCGIAIRFSLEQLDQICCELVDTGKIKVSAIYSYYKTEEGNRAELILQGEER
ncbi:DUF3343 domain-containing protein [Bacillus licheniformis]|uniref:DUF3343 domain-containing protein n=1 Tax=Bacillus licheniformis TaxID=1402 RepID=UPI000F5DEBF2|nr:DUF3343 domain-containing protein [Bacillus licheniformis]